jgi:plasmid stabilization system protein ParE
LRVAPAPRALADLERLKAFLRPKSPSTAERAGEVIEKAMDSLSFMPRRGRPILGTEFRELIAPFGKGAYILRYVVDDDLDAVIVLRIWHSREQRG